MTAISDDVRRFLVAHIDSVEQLEVLLLLYRAPGTAWTAEAVAQALYSQPSSVIRRLESLHRDGLLSNVGASSYQYEQKPDPLHQTIARLADTYRERRVAVITAIASKPMENVRAFSEAFRFRKKDEED